LPAYSDTVRFLYSLGNEVKAARLGLDRMETLLAALDNPHRGGRFVHVGGTNGKGSTCAMIESGLRAGGMRTGLYTSPHLAEPTERIRIAGEPVSQGQFVSAFLRVRQAAERLLASEALDAHPTYFETVTAMAFLLFRDLACDAVVLEVGLGGRLDATNVVTPQLAVLTPIDFDHEVFLGRGLESIAAEKAGILKPGASAVFAPQRPEVEPVLTEAAAAAGVVPVQLGGPSASWKMEQLEIDREGCRFQAVAQAVKPAAPAVVPAFPGQRQKAASILIECPLRGEHQAVNALTAVAALDALGVPAAAIREGIRRTVWPGRLELVSRVPEIILDGAHNPAGARALAAYVKRFYSGNRVQLIYGAMRDKAVAEMTGILFPLAHEVILTAPRQARAVRPETIAEMVDHPRLRIAPALPEALRMFAPASPGDVTFITGSLYLVGEARQYLVQ
jgi:dihydrofolate synthase/folylpolyglutamate synthase